MNCTHCDKGTLQPVYAGSFNQQCNFCWALFDMNGTFLTSYQNLTTWLERTGR